MVSTPVAAPVRKFDPWIVVWVTVESGALYTVLTIGALAVSFPVESVSYFLSYILAQVSVREITIYVRL